MCEFVRWEAAPAPAWPPQDGGPYRVHVYGPYEVVEVRLRIEGRVRTGVLVEHADRHEGRALHLWFTPRLPGGERDRWVWWSPDRMLVHLRSGRSPLEDTTADGDASPVPPDARQPRVETHRPRTPLPAVDVRLAGTWHPARLVARVLLPGSREMAVVWVMLPAPGWPTARFTRSYWCDPATIRPRPPSP